MMRGEVDMLYEVAPDALDFIEQSSNTQVRSFLRPVRSPWASTSGIRCSPIAMCAAR